MDTKSPTERLQALLPQLFETDRKSGDRYLLFDITPKITAAITLDQIWEATRLSANAVTPIPLMAPYVLGWSSGRDRVYCIIDLADFLTLDISGKIPRQYSVIVVQVPKAGSKNSDFSLLGLSVNRIIRTVTSTEEVISPEEEPEEALVPYLKGCVPIGAEKIPLLDLNAMVAKMTT